MTDNEVKKDSNGTLQFGLKFLGITLVIYLAKLIM